MAIKESLKTVNKSDSIQKFYKKNKRHSTIIVVAFQIVAAATFATALHVSGILTFDDPVLWILAGTSLVIGVGVNILVLSIIIEPLRAISIALAHTAGENLDVKPPSPNDRPYIENGTKPLLELIYNLGVTTESKVSHTRLMEAARIEEGIARSQVGVALLNSKGKIIYANARAPIKTSQRGKQKIAVDFNNGDKVQLFEWIRNCQKNTVHADKIWTRLHTTLPAAETRRIFDVVASYSRGGVAETTLFFIDRTEDYANDERDLDFIAFAAHELRGPITIIRGYIDVLSEELDKKLTDDQRILFDRITLSSNRLTTYINNVLNVSRYDRNHYAVHLSEQSVYEIYDSIAEDMYNRAKAQNRDIQVKIDPDLPMVAADPSSITEVFSNLIDNAIKYSNEGGTIEVYAKVAGDFVEVTVKDHGIGMPDNVVRNLFHKFYRSHRSRESVGGSGIGLYLSKGIIDSHGGSISVISSEDSGSTFTFSLPVYATVEEKLKSGNNRSSQPLLKKKKIWISNHNMYRG
ncbi:HAMP domain-containing histidine kinase [Candidatus Saccharibacteria bacterium]|jgi:signal transduction histidine kinase|nr:HAMP domain-containing histidine kinase [Candidatus Saccharibacteria bacterium]